MPQIAEMQTLLPEVQQYALDEESRYSGKEMKQMNSIRRNVELKARLADLNRARDVARELGAAERGVLEQRDTYFAAQDGRLKLREETGNMPTLIWYERPDAVESRTSRYILVEVADGDGLLHALTSAHGVRGVVAKRRELYQYENVRIHLDSVEQLGAFLEFEAVLAADQPESEGHEILSWLRTQFGIAEADLIESSYSDLLFGES